MLTVEILIKGLFKIVFESYVFSPGALHLLKFTKQLPTLLQEKKAEHCLENSVGNSGFVTMSMSSIR